MENQNEISIRFRAVLLDGKWIANTNFKDLLTTLNWQQANKKIGNLNTIAALAQHINYYIAGVLNVFEGGNLEIRDQYSFDFPVVESAAGWASILNNLFSNAEKFAKHLEQLSTEKLDQDFVAEKYGSYRRNMDGMIEHCYYHLGQIALLKKLILEGEQ